MRPQIGPRSVTRLEALSPRSTVSDSATSGWQVPGRYPERRAGRSSGRLAGATIWLDRSRPCVMSPDCNTPESIKGWIVNRIAEYTGRDATSFDPTLPFERYGLASRDLVILAGDIEDGLGIQVSPVALYEHSTLERLAAHLAGISPSPLQGSTTARP